MTDDEQDEDAEVDLSNSGDKSDAPEAKRRRVEAQNLAIENAEQAVEAATEALIQAVDFLKEAKDAFKLLRHNLFELFGELYRPASLVANLI